MSETPDAEGRGRHDATAECAGRAGRRERQGRTGADGTGRACAASAGSGQDRQLERDSRAAGYIAQRWRSGFERSEITWGALLGAPHDRGRTMDEFEKEQT